MNFLEKDLERIIYETPNDILLQRGLYVNGKKLRQVKISTYGVADLISYNIDRCGKEISIQIFELKQNEINTETFLQAIRYKRGIQRYLQKTKRFDDFYVNYQIILLGKTVEERTSFCYIFDTVDDLIGITYRYEFDGIYFSEESGYFSRSEDFSNTNPF